MRSREVTLTFYGVILNVFIRHGGCHGQGVTPDAGGDVRDAEWQRAALGLVDQAWHGCRSAGVLAYTQSCAGCRLWKHGPPTKSHADTFPFSTTFFDFCIALYACVYSRRGSVTHPIDCRFIMIACSTLTYLFVHRLLFDLLACGLFASYKLMCS